MAEDDDNSVLLGDEGYIGVSDEYQNAAYGTGAPMRSDDPDVAALEDDLRSKEDATKAQEVGFRGYESNVPHPTEARQPAQDYIDANRAAVEAWLDQD